MEDAINIKKDEICKLNFTPILLTDKKKRQVNLNLSSAIDNLNKFQKGTIYFSTTRGVFQTTAKIMMKGDEFVVLKGDILIPVASILKVGI